MNLRRRVRVSSLLIGVGFYIGVLLVQSFLYGGDTMPWSLTQRVDRDIDARVNFSFEDKAATEEKRQKAREVTPSVFIFDAGKAALEPKPTIRAAMLDLRDLVAKAGSLDPGSLKQQAATKGWQLDDGAIAALRQFAPDARRTEYERMVDLALSRLLIVGMPEDPGRKSIPPNSLLVSKDKNRATSENLVDSNKLIYLQKSKTAQIGEQIAAVFHTIPACPEALHKPLTDIVLQVVVGPNRDKPSYTPFWQYDARLTDERMNAAAEKVAKEMITYNAGMTLVRARTVLGPAELTLLTEEHKAYLDAQRQDPVLRHRKLLRQVGTAMIALMAIIGLAAYTVSYRPRITQNPSRTLALSGLLLLTLVFCRLTDQMDRYLGFGSDLPAEACIFFIVITAALLAIAYDQRFSLGVSATLTILATLTVNGDFSLFLNYMTAAGVMVVLLKDIRTRSRIIWAGAVTALATALMSAATSLLAEQQLLYIVTRAAIGGSMALLAGFIVQGILPHFEKVFGVATSMTLLEWCDASKPLLRRVAQETPGTYSHSLVLSQMAEEACETIGARGLLARVGALYHDIGKAQKPEYFVENQEAKINRHDRLSPTLSLLIIVGHIKDGIEMARAYGLPRVLHQFINEHHGTTVIRYFHHVASEAAARSPLKGKHDREVPESEFRYPGPKPRSKESAILMLCDGCEGAVRALVEVTPGRVESTVHHVIMDRLNDGQLDDCEITLRELHLVEQSIVKSLCAIHHGRIKYPKGERQTSSAAAKPQVVTPDSATPQSGAARTPEVLQQA